MYLSRRIRGKYRNFSREKFWNFLVWTFFKNFNKLIYFPKKKGVWHQKPSLNMPLSSGQNASRITKDIHQKKSSCNLQFSIVFLHHQLYKLCHLPPPLHLIYPSINPPSTTYINSGRSCLFSFVRGRLNCSLFLLLIIDWLIDEKNSLNSRLFPFRMLIERPHQIFCGDLVINNRYRNINYSYSFANFFFSNFSHIFIVITLQVPFFCAHCNLQKWKIIFKFFCITIITNL